VIPSLGAFGAVPAPHPIRSGVVVSVRPPLGQVNNLSSRVSFSATQPHLAPADHIVAVDVMSRELVRKSVR